MNDDTAESLLSASIDLVVVNIFVMLMIGAVLSPSPQGIWGFVRIPLGFLFVFLLPGYAIAAALYPASNSAGGGTPGLQATERLVISIGLSIAAVPLIGLFWNFTPWGIDILQILGSIGVVTVVATLIAAYQRFTLSPSRRFRIDYLGLGSALWTAHQRAASRVRVLNIVVILLLVLSTVGLGVAIGFPGDGEKYTELYLLTTDEDTGQLTANDYPTDFTVGEARPVVIGVANHEQRTVEYSVLVVLQRVGRISGDEVVQESTRLDRIDLELEAGESVRQGYEIQPETEGQNLRLTMLLYKSNPPADPTRQNAYRETHLWIDVQGSG